MFYIDSLCQMKLIVMNMVSVSVFMNEKLAFEVCVLANFPSKSLTLLALISLDIRYPTPLAIWLYSSCSDVSIGSRRSFISFFCPEI